MHMTAARATSKALLTVAGLLASHDMEQLFFVQITWNEFLHGKFARTFFEPPLQPFTRCCPVLSLVGGAAQSSAYLSLSQCLSQCEAANPATRVLGWWDHIKSQVFCMDCVRYRLTKLIWRPSPHR